MYYFLATVVLAPEGGQTLLAMRVGHSPRPRLAPWTQLSLFSLDLFS